MRIHIRNQRNQTQGVFFLIGKSDESDQRTKILEYEIENSMISLLVTTLMRTKM